jgi:uncharacterized phiE125 gp8 family phage protein
MPTTRVVTSPAIEPVQLTDVKAHLVLSGELDDGYLTALISAVRTHVETVTRRALITQTLEYVSDVFCSEIVLSTPALSITSIWYTDTTGVDTLLVASKYQADIYSGTPRIRPTHGNYWPVTYPEMNAVRVRYQAGYGPAATDVPSPIRHAMMMMIAHLYAHRESVAQTAARGAMLEMPQGFDMMLWPYRVVKF